MNEKEAIKQLKQWISVIDLKKKSNIIPNTDDIQAIETVLNLLEKKDKIINNAIIEIEVGNYVRFEDGKIERVTYQLKEFIDEHISKSENNRVEFLGKIKHSKNIIDLIEVKDVIKYRINNISTTLETKGYVEGIVDISDEEMLQKIKSDKNYHILEIRTKESYIANCYKVGGENE